MNNCHNNIRNQTYLLIAVIALCIAGFVNAADQSERIRAISLYERITASPSSMDKLIVEADHEERRKAIAIHEYITNISTKKIKLEFVSKNLRIY